MFLGVVQTKPEFGAVAQNIEQAFALMERDHADLYVLPELFNCGYNFIDAEEVQSLAEPAEGKTFQRILRWANVHRSFIVYGFAEHANGFYNSAAMVGPDGLIGLYRKVHLFDREKLFFLPGNLGFPVFELPLGKIGMMICFDWFFPEAARTLALKGAQVIAHPANLVLPYCPDAMITRSLENHVFTATADRIGREDRGGNELQFIGASQIVAYNGALLAQLQADEENISVVQIDLQRTDQKLLNNRNELFNDRREDQYR
ncbi:MAG TPA: nitrilase-related carbon-nitrogen hydrolase [Bacteroidota bacterium]|nr:nitrilase-related carbon-nitrogen hydrolase [Bacteroidota bacterium]